MWKTVKKPHKYGTKYTLEYWQYGDCGVTEGICIGRCSMALTIEGVWVNNNHLRDTDVRAFFQRKLLAGDDAGLCVTARSKAEKLMELLTK